MQSLIVGEDFQQMIDGYPHARRQQGAEWVLQGHLVVAGVMAVAQHDLQCTAAQMPPGGVVYSATKYAVRAISEGLRQEVKP